MKVLDEIRKGGPRPGQIAATKHEDLLMQTRMYHAGSGTEAYLRVVCSLAKADKPEGYTAMLQDRNDRLRGTGQCAPTVSANLILVNAIPPHHLPKQN